MQTDDTEIGELVRTRATRHSAPATLRVSIVGALPQEKHEPKGPAAKVRSPFRFAWMNLGAAFATGVLATVLLVPVWFTPTPTTSDTDEVVDSHIRSLQPGHLNDVISTDQHTVKPWFAGKLDYTPPVHDFAAAGFPLSGGRLDAVHGHTVAALVYRRRQHLINVYVMPSDKRDEKVSTETKRGFNIVRWQQGTMAFWAISDLNARELGDFVRLDQSSPD
jgi:anti-sigma factor RsiW